MFAPPKTGAPTGTRLESTMSHLEQITIDKEKQEAILDQALRLFMRHGVKSMTMDEANHPRISKKTLPVHITDKNDPGGTRRHAHAYRHTAVIDGICAQGLNAIDEQYEAAKYLAGLLSQHPSIHYDPRNTSQGVGASTVRNGRTSTSADP